MDAEPEISPPAKRPNVAAGIRRRVIQVAVFFILIAAILFLAAGRLDWTWAWVYLGIGLISFSVNAAIMLGKSPETIAERGRPRETKGWDRLVGGLWSLILYFMLPLVAGLDARFGWTGHLNPAWNVAGAMILALGLALSGWAMISNAYFSTAVRIQSDRGHTVCRTGPYRFVRHPGYVGFGLQSPGMALLFGSLWAFVPGAAAAAFMILRTYLEDRFLQAELPGYRDYSQEVRYRLVPGIW